EVDRDIAVVPRGLRGGGDGARRGLVDVDAAEDRVRGVAGLVRTGAAGRLVGALTLDHLAAITGVHAGKLVGAGERDGHVLVGPGARGVRAAVLSTGDGRGRGDRRGGLVDADPVARRRLGVVRV